MIYSRYPRGRAGALALLLSAALASSAGAQSTPPGGDDAPAQAEPRQEAPLLEGTPEEALPPPILPAPDIPTDDPVVELPPEGEPPPPVAGQPGAPAIPGLPTTPQGTLFSFADLAEELLGSVVYISTAQRVTMGAPTPLPDVPQPPDDEFFEDFFEDEQSPGGRGSRMMQSLGSGFVIDPSGLIVTNNHVIADADEIVANFHDGSKLTAEVIGIDDKTDLALIKVEPTKPLASARFGRSEALRVGDWVLAIGNPFGFGGTVTAGIVSALDRDINSGPYDHYIQTDASINRGNSGGPLFNLGGEVVGINTAIMSPTGGSIGIGFAVPSEIAVPIIEQLREFGSVRRGWIGVRIQDVTDEFAQTQGLDGARGALIAGTNAGGPAEAAGIKAGDIIVEFDGKPVESMRALPRMVADTPPEESVDVVVVREGERLTLQLVVGLLEDAKVAAAAEPDKPDDGESGEPPSDDVAAMFGITLGAITEEARRTYSIGPDVEGVLVAAVEPGSEAEEKAVKPGDVIVQVTQQKVDDPDEVRARIEELRAAGRRTVMLLVSGAQNKLRFVSLRFEEAPQPESPQP
jgi:serine protease Do